MTPIESSPPTHACFPLFLQVLIAAAAGAALGSALGRGDVLGVSAATLGDAGMQVIRALKVLATPLVFLAVLDGALRIEVPARKAGLLALIAAVNALAAIAIGLGVAHVFQAGTGAFAGLAPATPAPTHPAAAALGPIPASIIAPFADNAIVTVVALAILAGLSLRAVRAAEPTGMAAIEACVRAALAACVKALGWVVRLVPLAVFAVVTHVVAQTGFSVAGDLVKFLSVTVLGLLVHVGLYYSLVLAVVARQSPLGFFRGAADALTTALSCGSSLATLPVTLQCLDRMRVGPGSARLAACVGSNLNHDGIILYEAAAAIFVAQAFGFDLSLAQQIAIALAAIAAGLGIAGVPEAGLITLPLVLGAAGLPAAAVAAVVPALLPVDWIIGRFRAATNVTSDMVVAVVLDRLAPDVGVHHVR